MHLQVRDLSPTFNLQDWCSGLAWRSPKRIDMKKWKYKEIYNRNSDRPNGCVLEHRKIASDKLGRPLEDGEVVHHIDEDRANNSEENLMVFKTSGDHARFHQGGECTLLSDGSYISSTLYDNATRKEDGTTLTRCVDCNKEITCGTRRCVICNGLNNRKVRRPSKEELLSDISTLSFVSVGKKYGVSDNAVRKWCKGYGI